MQEDVYQEDGLNLYVYCGNNPVVYCDPSGYDKEFDWETILSATHGFNEWFDSMVWEDFIIIWKDKNVKDYIEDQIRAPGGLQNGIWQDLQIVLSIGEYQWRRTSSIATSLQLWML